MAWRVTPRTNCGGKKILTQKGVHPERMSPSIFSSSLRVGVWGVQPGWTPAEERKTSLLGGVGVGGGVGKVIELLASL